MSMLPKARSGQLLIEQVDGELVVYDREREKAHHLNPTAALIWQHCDGQTTIAEMTARLHETLGLPADEDVVWLALHELEQADLLGERTEWAAKATRASRRQVIKKLSALAILVPAVTSIVVPSPAMAFDGSPID